MRPKYAVPGTCRVAFKEWAGVCAALLEGRQSLILRKGGVDEASGGFRPEHDAFWLYPTYVHQAQQGLKPEARTAPDDAPDPTDVVLCGLAVVARVDRVENPEILPSIDSLHVWTAETVSKRYAYRTPGLWVLTVRIHRAPPARLKVMPEYAGCKTWVPLVEPLSTVGAAPVLDDGTFADAYDAIVSALAAGHGGTPP
jgi:hypothetical protein